jgi:uncharacterized membrane protein YkoI
MLNRCSSRNECNWRRLLFALGALFLACGGYASAAEGSRDHDRARQALEAGEVLPLRTILERVERNHPGQVVDVELEREHENGGERWIYEIKLLRSGGALIKLKVDARDGTIIGKKLKEAKEGPGRHEHGKEEMQKNRRSGDGN